MKMTTRRKMRDNNAPTMGKAVRALAKKGRAGDTEVAHLTPGEVVVPKRVWQADPGLRAQAFRAMQQAGLDPQQYVVGSSRNSRNPSTGAREFADLIYTDQGWVSASTGQAANFGQDQNSFANTGSFSGGNVAPTTEQNQVRPVNAMSAPAPGRNWGVADNQATNQQLANITGYAGDFGTGGFSSYMQNANDVQKQQAAEYLVSQGQGNRIDWNTGMTAPVDTSNDPFTPPPTPTRSWGSAQNVTANQGLAELTGYSGDFGGGAFNNWLATQPQSVTNQVGQFLFDNGQADRANLYAWDRNGNGIVEGTEAAGVTQNPSGSYTWPGGYEKGPLVDPFTPGKKVYQINPNIEGAPPEYQWGTAPNGVMPAGAWPETMMDPIFGTTTYNAAPPPNANGQWDRPDLLPWDVRNGGTGDPYVPWTPEWAAQQAQQGNGYAARALQNAGFDLEKIAPGATARLGGGGNPNGPGFDRGWQAQGFYQTKDGIWQTMEGVEVIPQGNGLFLDTMYGFLRNAQGIIVNADGSPVITQYNQNIGGSSDPWRVFGSSNALSMMGPYAGVDLRSLNDGNNTPIRGTYGGGSPTPIAQTFGGKDIVTDIRGDPWATSIYNRAAGGTGGPAGGPGGYVPQTGGVSTNPVNTGGNNPPTTTGTGLTPGGLNPYSLPLGYGGLNLFFGGTPQSGTGTNTQQQQSYVDPLSWLSLLNLGYGSSTYGYPTYQSADPAQGGLNYVTPNSQLVEFRSPFRY